MWRFVRSTDELVTGESSTSSTVNAASAQNRFPNSVIHYLKSTEGILRVVVILSSLLTFACLNSLPSTSFSRWCFFTSVFIATATLCLLIFYSLQIAHMAVFFPWFRIEFLYGIVFGVSCLANSVAWFVGIHEEGSVGHVAAAQGFNGVFYLVVCVVLIFQAVKSKRLINGGSTGPGNPTSDIVI